MATYVTAAMQQVTADIVALTPPDRPHVPFHHLDRREVESWTTLERGIRWTLPQRSAPAAMTARQSATLVEWVASFQIYVSRKGRGFWDFAAAVANETSLIARAIEARGVWPAGVGEVFVEPTTPDELREGAVINFNLTVLTEDDDS